MSFASFQAKKLAGCAVGMCTATANGGVAAAAAAIDYLVEKWRIKQPMIMAFVCHASRVAQPRSNLRQVEAARSRSFKLGQSIRRYIL